MFPALVKPNDRERMGWKSVGGRSLSEAVNPRVFRGDDSFRLVGRVGVAQGAAELGNCKFPGIERKKGHFLSGLTLGQLAQDTALIQQNCSTGNFCY